MNLNFSFLGKEIKIGDIQPRSKRTNSTAFFDTDNISLKIDKTDLYSIWRHNVDVYSCVRKIRQTGCIGGVDYYLPKDREKEAMTSDKALVLSILSYFYGDPRRFKNEVYKHLLISGDCFIEKVYDRAGRPLGLKVLDSRTIRVVQDQHGKTLAYIQGGIGDNFLTGDVVVFEPQDIIHWRLEIDPDNEAFGFSPIEATILEAKTDNEAAASNLAFFKNHSVPPAHFILDPDLSEEDEKNVVEKLRKFFRGSKNRGRSLAMKGLKEIKSIKLTHEEMQFLTGREFATKKVASAFGVPAVLLGHTDGVNFSNHEGQMQDFYDSTVADYDLSYTQLMNQDIIGGFLGIQDRILMSVKPPTFEARSKVWERAMKARELGLIDINTARSMVNIDPIDESIHADFGNRIILGNGGSSVLLTDIGQAVDDQAKQLDSIKKYLLDAESKNNDAEY